MRFSANLQSFKLRQMSLRDGVQLHAVASAQVLEKTTAIRALVAFPCFAMPLGEGYGWERAQGGGIWRQKPCQKKAEKRFEMPKTWALVLAGGAWVCTVKLS